MAHLRYLVLLVLVTVQASLGSEPRLEILPDNILKAVGDGVYVSCTALVEDGELVTEMEWTRPDGRKIENNVDDTVSTSEDGTDAKLDLIISKLREQDVGEYTCSATYAGNQKLEAKVMVESYMNIDFGDTPEHQTLLIGQEGKVKCTPKAKPSPQVDWFKNQVPLRNDESHVTQQDGILITEVTEADEGTYRCRARVPQLGSIKQLNIQVEVYIPPVIDQPPQDLKGKETESVKFECGATGKPAPVYTWVDKDNRPLEELEGYHVDSDTGDLTILDLKPEQTGEYRCTATNSAGEDFKKAFLQVLTKPKVEQYLNLTVPVGSEAEMRCVVTGSPKPQVVFKKESEPNDFVSGINVDDRIIVSQETDDQGREVGVLKIRDVARSDDGLYTCTAQSEGGVTQVWGHITVEFKPSFEDQGPTVQWSWEKAPVNLTCVATSIPNATVQWYLRGEEINYNDVNLERKVLGPVGVLWVNPVSSSYFGIYTCEATNTLGTSSLDLELKEAHKPGPIASAKEEKVTATTITWSLVDPADNGGLPIQRYIVEYRERDHSWDDAIRRVWSKGTTYTIDNLIPQTGYVFRFAAGSKAGDGEWGGEKSVEMPRHAEPEEPLIFDATETVLKIPYPSHYDLQWKVPLDNGMEIDHFQIVYYQVKEKAGKWEAIGDKTTQEVEHPGSTSYRIEGLSTDSYYKIELRAHNDIGYSTPAEAIIKTASGPITNHTVDENGLGTGIIVAIIVIVLVVVLVVVDVSCYCTRNAGLTAIIAGKRGSTDKDKEAMLEDGKHASEDIPEGNGQTKIQEEDLKPKPEEDSNKKVKESTEPTETTPMIQRHSLQGSAIKRTMRPSSQNNVLETSEDSIPMQLRRNNLTKPPLLNPPGTKATKPNKPKIVELVRKNGNKENTSSFHAQIPEDGINSNVGNLTMMSRDIPLIDQSSHDLIYDDDSLYAKPSSDSAISTPPPRYTSHLLPPPLPRRNKISHSQEMLSDPLVIQRKEDVNGQGPHNFNLAPGSCDNLNTLGITKRTDDFSQVPKNVKSSFSGDSSHLGKRESANSVKPQHHHAPRNRDTLNQPQILAYDDSNTLSMTRAKKASPQASPRSGYTLRNGNELNPSHSEATFANLNKELIAELKTKRKKSDTKWLEEFSQLREAEKNVGRPPKTPSISSNSTLYQPADAGYQHSTRTAYKVAPYDDPSCQDRPVPSQSCHTSQGLKSQAPNERSNKHVMPSSTAITPTPREESHIQVPSQFAPLPTALGEENTIPQKLIKVHYRVPQLPQHSLSMDNLDSSVDTQRSLSIQPSSDHCSSKLLTAKSLNSLLDCSSSSMRCYGQPTLL